MGEDVTVNTFHFFHAGTTLNVANAIGVSQQIKDFYQTADAVETSSISGYLANELLLQLTEMRFYDAMGVPPQYPYFTATIDMDSTRLQLDDLPSECAVVLSYKALPTAGVKAARQRGRLYIGPMNGFSVEHTLTGTRVRSALRNTMAGAAKRLVNNIEALAGAGAPIEWVVFSRGKGSPPTPTSPGTPDWAPFTSRITNGWVDNAWDTQRRRGLDATVRTLWSE